MTSEKVDYGDKDLVVRSIKALDGGLDSSTFSGIQTKILQNESNMTSISGTFQAQIAQIKGEIDNISVVILSLSTPSVTRSRLGTMSPSTLSISAKKQDGSPYLGRFMVKVSHDGINYQFDDDGDYTSASDESSYSYTVPAFVDYLGTAYFVASIMVQVYASGGTTDLLAEKMCSVSLDPSTTAVYWGPLTSDPTGNLVPGDYYFDNNDVGTGNAGDPMVYTGTEWTEYLSSMAGYQGAMVTMLPDMGAWATEQGETIAAASAIFQKLVTADAFIANLFTQYITVGTGGRIQYETGSGVQKRVVRLHDEKIDWVDIPDTSPASPEQLRFRLGRLGVGGAVLADGEMLANCEQGWSTQSTIVAASSLSPYVMEVDSGDEWIFYTRNSDSRIVYRIRAGGILGIEVDVSGASAYLAYAIQKLNGDILIFYTLSSSGVLCIRQIVNGVLDTTVYGFSPNAYGARGCMLSDGSILVCYTNGATHKLDTRVISSSSFSWSDATAVTSDSGYTTQGDMKVMPNGDVLLVYINEASFYDGFGTISSRIRSGTVFGSATTVVSTSSSNPAIEKLINDTFIMTYRKVSDNYLYQMIYDTAGWGSPLLINSVGTYDSALVQRASGELKVLYTIASTYYLVERTLQRYAQVGAGIIASGGTGAPGEAHWEKKGNGYAEIWGRAWPSTSNANALSRTYNIVLPINLIADSWSLEASMVDVINTSYDHVICRCLPTAGSEIAGTVTSYRLGSTASTGYGYINWTAKGRYV